MNRLAKIYRDWRSYRRTHWELSRLSIRELDDLGIDRANISRVARQTSMA